jgi:hypothetical protein
VRTYKWSGVSRDGLDNLDRWLNVMKEKPGLRAGVEVPFSVDSLLEDEEAQEKFEQNARKTLQTWPLIGFSGNSVRFSTRRHMTSTYAFDSVGCVFRWGWSRYLISWRILCKRFSSVS